MQHETAEERASKAGSSTVVIRQSKEPNIVKFDTWVSDLGSAIKKLYDCQAFSTQSKCAITWTFHGIAEHTVAAATAFEVMHFLVLDGSSAIIGVGARNSYCMGAAKGLCVLADEEVLGAMRIARENEQKALATKVREEQLARNKKIARLQDL